MVELGYWKPGDEIVTVAACFPTTSIRCCCTGCGRCSSTLRCRPITWTSSTWSARYPSTARRGSCSRTRSATRLTCPVYDIAERYGLRVIEDCCDALGRHTTTGTSGSAPTPLRARSSRRTTSRPARVAPCSRGTRDVIRAVESISSWGRDCWCEPGANDTCGQRFYQQFGELAIWLRPQEHDDAPRLQPQTYRRGSSLRPGSNRSAARVCICPNQKLWFSSGTAGASIWSAGSPRSHAISQPSWFGFPITIKEPGLRADLQRYLSQRGVDSRLLFAGNVTRQPYMRGRNYLVASTLEVTDKVMNDCLWIGLHPALTEEQLTHSSNCILDFFGEFA
jgi:CDP-6-deoxy-D-xylo-4-hexulose-3-dehydrase